MKVELAFENITYKELEATGDYSRITVKLPGTNGIFFARFRVHIVDMHGYWTPEFENYYFIPSAKLPWLIETNSAAQQYIPYLAFFNSANINSFSCSTTSLIDDTRITASMNQELCTYDITIEVALTEGSEDFELILDSRKILWTKALSDWREKLNVIKPQFPSAAWDPVYCTWYAMHAEVNGKWALDNAKAAKELGFRTFIVDDGWCFDDNKRVSPETIGSWYENIGSWRLSDKKFPEYEKHLADIHDCDMNYMFWVAPFMLGAKSELFERHVNDTDNQYHEGACTMDPALSLDARLMLDRIESVMADYKLDGLKVDFLDLYKPDIKKPRGRIIYEFIDELSRRIRSQKSDALIEFRQGYFSPCILHCATQFRAGDAPFDFLENFRRIAFIRLCVGDFVPVHADPVYWNPDESPVNIARHMIASIAGVPMISMDLPKRPESELEMIRKWIAFYNEHKCTFMTGHWDISYHQSGISYMSVTTKDERIVILNDPARITAALEGAPAKIFVLNLSCGEVEVNGATTFGPEWNPDKNGIIPRGGCGIIL